MPRKKRIIQPNFCYHIMLRGNGGQAIFKEDSDYSKLCLLMQYAVEKHDFLIHGFCFMSNHIHLLVEACNNELSKGMHAFSFRYAQYFNQKYDRCGHLFQGRFKAILVQRGTYLCRLIRYIHRNPVRAGIAKRTSDYIWSSHRAYLLEKIYTWLTRDTILSIFTQKAEEENFSVINLFKKYIEMDDADAKEHVVAIRNSLRLGIYGNEEFVKNYGDNNLKKIYPYVQEKISLAQVVQTTCDILQLDQNELRGVSRRESLVQARAILALLVDRTRIATLSELAILLSRDQSSLSRLRQKAESDTYCLQIADEVNKHLLDTV